MLKKISLILSLLLLLTAFVSCADIPFGSESSDKSSSSRASSNNESAKSGSETSGIDESSQPDESSADPVPLDLPYPDPASALMSSLKIDGLDDYFKDSVFIGNSIMQHYKKFYNIRITSDASFLGKATIYGTENYSALRDFERVSENSYHLLVNGERIKAGDAVKNLGAGTVYLSVMALNELALHSKAEECVANTYDNTIKLIKDIQSKNPGIKIAVLSNTYMVKEFNSMPKLNNKHISELNNLVLDYCNENGLDFIDISTDLMENGCLAAKFCNDNHSGGSGCHLTNDAYAVWTVILRNYAFAKQNGFYKNPETMPSYTKG